MDAGAVGKGTDPNPTDVKRLLLPQEARFLTGDFAGYFLSKRHNFIATVNNYPDIARLYFDTDETWIHALNSLEHVNNHDWIVPIQLTIFCFRELRLAAELLLSCCTTQGYSHLRVAIESFIQAQKICREPSLGAVWLQRDDDLAEYNRHFKHQVKENLFPQHSGFSHLHGIWTMLCDAGPHSNVTSVGMSSSTTSSETEVLWKLEFFEVDQGEVTKNLVLLLKCQLEMFKHVFNVFHNRLSLHPQLLPSLHSLLARFEQVRAKYAPASL